MVYNYYDYQIYYRNIMIIIGENTMGIDLITILDPI
jgi:hypothetical protein